MLANNHTKSHGIKQNTVFYHSRDSVAEWVKSSKLGYFDDALAKKICNWQFAIFVATFKV